VLVDDDEDVVLQLAAAGQQQDTAPVRIEGYGEFVVPSYSDEVFKEHFRMHRTTFQVSLQLTTIT